MIYDKYTAIEILRSVMDLKGRQSRELMTMHGANPAESSWNVERAELLQGQVSDLLKAIRILEKDDVPEKRTEHPLEAVGGVSTRTTGFERFCNAVLAFCNGNPTGLISGIAVLVLVMVIFAGCTSISGNSYPWSDPLTDEHGNQVPPPSWTNKVEVTK